MVATLRVMLDQVAAPTDPDLALASRELARALVARRARGVRGRGDRARGSGRRAWTRSPRRCRASPACTRSRSRAESSRLLCSSGVATGIGGGMLHSPTLFAPLVKHDRVHDNDQTVVTLWDLRAWEAPDELSPDSRRLAARDAQARREACGRRRRADALDGFGARRDWLLGWGSACGSSPARRPWASLFPRTRSGDAACSTSPRGSCCSRAGSQHRTGWRCGFAAIAESGLDVPVLVIDAGEGEEPGVSELASAAGIP